MTLDKDKLITDLANRIVDDMDMESVILCAQEKIEDDLYEYTEAELLKTAEDLGVSYGKT